MVHMDVMIYVMGGLVSLLFLMMAIAYWRGTLAVIIFAASVYLAIAYSLIVWVAVFLLVGGLAYSGNKEVGPAIKVGFMAACGVLAVAYVTMVVVGGLSSTDCGMIGRVSTC